jgi:uncharacterized protein
MSGFVGRTQELLALETLLDEARSGQGVMVAVRGRRQVGKSRLVSEFVERAGVPAVFATASRRPAQVELAHFVDAARTSGLSALTTVSADAVGSWEAALLLATADAAPGRPMIIVIDELPDLTESEPAIEAILQKVWQTLERRAVLFILIGSDVSIMEALTEYRRPLYGRAREMVVHPLTVADVARMNALSPEVALDVYLVIGGFPRLATRWRKSDTVTSFVRREFADEASPLVVTGERVMSGELPSDLNARAVLTAIGAGERSHGAILSRSGVGRGTFEKALALLAEKRIVQRTTPYAEPRTNKVPRYTVADPYLRFWLRFVQPGMELIARGRSDLAVARVVEGWPTYRGRAVEPLVRASLERLLPHPALGSAEFVGAFWTKDNRVEVDLVGGREPERAREIDFVGSIKWRDRGPFTRDDLAALLEARSRVPGVGAKTRLVGVSRTGFAIEGLDATFGPRDLVAAWDTGG